MSDQSPAESTPASNDEVTTVNKTTVDKNVESMKERIIATSKLLKYVQTAKTELEEKNKLIITLENRLKDVKKLSDENQQKTEQLAAELAKSKSDSNASSQQQTAAKDLDILEQKLAAAEEAKHKAEEASKSQKMYIIQLEASVKELKEQAKKSSENTKVTDKARNEMNKKTEELRKVNKELAIRDKKVHDLEAEIDTLRQAKEKLEDDAIENSLNTEMIQHDYQELKEEMTKMESKVESFITENAALQDQNKELLNKVEQLNLAAKSVPSPKPRRSSSLSSSSSLNKMVEQQPVDESLKNALYLSEAQREVIEMENKFLKAKLTRLMARQRVRDEPDTIESIIKRQQQFLQNASDDGSFSMMELSPRITPSASMHSDLDNYQEPPHISALPYPRARSRSSSSIKNANIASSPPPPQSHKQPVKINKAGLTMPPSLITPNKAKTSASSSRKSKLEKFVKNPSRYATKSSFIPLTQVGGSEHIHPKEKTPSEVTQKEETSPPTQQSTMTVNEPSNPPPPVPIYLQKRPFDDTSSDDEEDTPAAKKSHVELPFELMVEKLILNKKLPSKEELKKYTTQSGLTELFAEIIGLFRRLKSTANPMPKTGKPIVFKQHGIRNVLMVTLPDNLDKKEKNVSWFLRVLATQCPDHDISNNIKERLKTHIMTIFESKKTDNAVYRLIRLLTSFCKESYDTKFIYRLCFDICRQCEVEQHILLSILNVAFVWNDGLVLNPMAEISGKGSHIVIKTVQRLTHHIANRDNDIANKNALYTTIAKLTKWPSVEESQGLYQMTEEIGKVFNSEVMEEVHNASQSIFDDLRCCIIKCLEAIFFYINDWKTIFDDYIRGKLWPMLNEEIVDDIALELLGILGMFGVAKLEGEENKAGVSNLTERFELLIQLGDEIPDDAKHLQITAAKGRDYLTGKTPLKLPEWV